MATENAYRRAKPDGKQVFGIRTWCKLSNLEANRGTSISRETARRTGFLHIDRATPEFREGLLQSVLARLAKSLDAPVLEALRGLKLKEVMLRYPESAAWILESEPSVNLIVHEARLRGSPTGELVYVGTMRKKMTKTMLSNVIYAEDRIAVSY